MNEQNEYHDFDEKLEEGKRHEAELDNYFRDAFNIHKATMNEERLGIDRAFVPLKPPYVYMTVEYKADTMAAETGNAFIELLSVDSNGKAGWAITSLSQLLVYYVPPLNKAWGMDMMIVKRNLRHWIEEFPIGKAQNKDYASRGVLVPLNVCFKEAIEYGPII